MRLVQVSLCARKDVESSFHGCGRPVKLVQASVSAREDQFMSTTPIFSVTIVFSPSLLSFDFVLQKLT